MGKWNGLPHEPQFLCGAFARTTGEPCKRFASKNGRCKLHGGRSTGANNPAIKHGRYAKDSIKQRKQYADLLRNSKILVNEMLGSVRSYYLEPTQDSRGTKGDNWRRAIITTPK